jgi:hypothetical protein
MRLRSSWKAGIASYEDIEEHHLPIPRSHLNHSDENPSQAKRWDASRNMQAMQQDFVDHIRGGGMNKYQVPAGMLDAAVNAVDEEGRVFLSSYPHWPGMDACLRAALHWLLDNPIMPTPEQSLELRDLALRNDGQISAASCHAVAVEWQRRMFLAPPDPLFTDNSQDFIKSISGYTFTPEEAYKIKKHIDDCTHLRAFEIPTSKSGIVK